MSRLRRELQAALSVKRNMNWQCNENVQKFELENKKEDITTCFTSA